jgi:N utilization substance protein B
MGIRRKSRECALQVLFQLEFHPPDAGEVLSVYWKANKVSEKIREYTEFVVLGVLAHRDEIDAIISRKATNWRIERMTLVDRNIFRIAIYEFLYQSDVPRTVVINEALEIAKKFSTDESAHFINGILDSVKRSIEEDSAE